MKNHIRTIDEFKAYATSVWVPDYFKVYVESLDEEKLEWFYNQVKDTLDVLACEEYLLYKFKWILNRPFTDLTKEIYVEYLYNPEMFKFDIIKPEYGRLLDKKYENDFDVKNYYRWF